MASDDDDCGNFFDLNAEISLKDILEGSRCCTSSSLESVEDAPSSKRRREMAPEDGRKVGKRDGIVIVGSENSGGTLSIGSLTPPPEISQELLQEIREISKILKDKGEELNPALARSGSEEGSADMCGDREISPSRPASARRGPKAEVIEIELKFLSWRGNRRLSKPARIRLLSTSTFENMVASVCKRRKLDENKVVFLHRRTQLFRHGTPEIVRMPTEAVVEVMLREDYLKERSDELRHIENRSSAIFGDDPYITLKISSAQGGHPDGRLYLEGELLNPSFRICDFNIEDNDILELH